MLLLCFRRAKPAALLLTLAGDATVGLALGFVRLLGRWFEGAEAPLETRRILRVRLAVILIFAAQAGLGCILNRRVLLVNKFYAPSAGGIETAVQQYAHWYKELGWDVTVLCCAHTRSWGTKRQIIANVDVVRAASFGNLLSVPLSVAFFLHFIRLARKVDVVHVNLQFPWASLALCLFGWAVSAKKVVSYHCDVYRQRYLKQITYFFDTWVVRIADTVIVGSPVLRRCSQVLGRLSRPMKILPYSIDAKYVAKCLGEKPSIELPEHFKSEGYFLFFGRLVPYKGTQIMDEAFRRLMHKGQSVNLMVFGVGPEESRFKSLASDFPGRVCFVNKVLSDVDKYHLLKGCQAFLFPSVFYSEAFGIAQLDAMACAKPIINCKLDTGVNWVALDGEGAITLPSGDVEALAEAIISMQAIHYDLDAMGAKGLERYQGLFTDSVVRNAFYKVVSEF